MGLSWDAPELQVTSDNRRTARYRLLQSWYRESVLEAQPGTYVPRNRSPRRCGSLLHPDDVLERPDLNFLDKRVYRYAVERSAVVRAEHGTLDDDRLRLNMLSSMPMCFNLFGMVRESLADQLRFVQSLFDPAASAVELIECEWTPRDPASSNNDRSAFDAVIITRRPDGGRHLIGIETKYTEPFSATRYGAEDRRRDAGRYRDVHSRSGWFDPAAHDRLTGSSTNQLWRNCLLAAAAELSDEFDSADVVVVALSDDRAAATAVSGINAAMTDPRRCRQVSLEAIIDTSRALPSLSEWAGRFEERYLDLGPIR